MQNTAILLIVAQGQSLAIILILGLGLRIVGALVCSKRARKLNRNTGGWGFFGFISPLIAMICVQFIKPKNDWESNEILHQEHYTKE